MTRNWQEVYDEIMEEVIRIELTPPEEVVNIFKYGIVKSGIGSYKQHYNGYPFIHGGMRMLGYYIIPSIYRMASNEKFDMDHLRFNINLIKIETEFLGYTGFKNVEKYGDYLIELADQMDSKEDFKQLLDAYAMYIEFVNCWIQHFYPWNIGISFPRKSREELLELAEVINKECS